MSSTTRARIMKNMKDLQIFKETLKELHLTFQENKNINQITLSEKGIIFETGNNNVQAKYNSRNTEANNILNSIQNTYDKLLEEKLNELRKQKEALEREKELSGAMNEENVRKEISLKQNEINKLEKIKKAEKRALEEEISKKIEILKERAQKNGFEFNIANQGNKQVLTLFRRT